MSKAPEMIYILSQRLITFFDEWMFYGLLCLLIFWLEADWKIIVAVAVIGTLAILNSYRRLWRMEENLLNEDKRRV